MKASRLAFLLLGIGVLLLLGLIFPQFVFAAIIEPVATVLWLLLRLFVLSIDQEVYWGLLILVGALFALIRLVQSSNHDTVEQYEPPDVNPTLENIDRWRVFFQPTSSADGENDVPRRELTWLMTSIYASRQQEALNYQVKALLESGEIPLPPPVYAFLFPKEPAETAKPFFQDPLGALGRYLLSIWRAPQRWARRWSGQEMAEFYRAIDQVLALMETSMEIKHDDPNSPNQH